MPDWLSVLLASAGGVLLFLNTVAKSDAYKAFAYWVKFLAVKKERKQLPGGKATLRQIRAMQALSEGLEEIRELGDYARANAIVLHNGGKDVTDPGTTKHVTVFETAAEGVSQDSRRAWKKNKITKGYRVDIISGLHTGQPFIARTEDLNDDNDLKAYYIIDGIKCGIVNHSVSVPGAVWYISLNSKHDVKDFPDTIEDVLRHSAAFEHARRASELLRKLVPHLPKPEELYDDNLDQGEA